MSKSHTKRFVQSAWALLSFQFIASVGAVAVTGLAAFHVQNLAARLEGDGPRVEEPEQARDPRSETQTGSREETKTGEERNTQEETAAPAIGLCQRQQNIIRVMANVEWCDADIQVQPGQRLIFAVDGHWSHSGEPVLDPSGGDVHEPRALDSRSPHGALIGRAGRHVFLIGAGGEVQARDAGPLHLSINDVSGQFADNPGYVDVFAQVAGER